MNETNRVCEETGKPIAKEGLQVIAWARFAREIEARLENEGRVRRAHLGTLGSVREEVTGDLEASESEEEKQPPAAGDESLREISSPARPTHPRPR